MVATLFKLSDPSAAVNYYEVDDYYVGDAKAPSAWHGRGAAKLGLHREVEPEAFSAMLHGKLPNGKVLGTVRKGVRKHKAAWDLTFSAPKSVSILALVAGDRRLIDAHDQAVRVALDYAEKHAAVTRIREGKKAPRIATGNLVIATFPHFTARETEAHPDPQIHTHCIIMNATEDDSGTWRSIESQPLYKMHKALIGKIYHQHLAAEVQAMGYSVSINHDGLFTVDGISTGVQEAFSNRSLEIEAALAARGQNRANATAAEKAVIALDTRMPKERVEHHELTTLWRTRADALGFGEDVRRGLVTDAKAKSAENKTLGTRARMRAADRAVAFAAVHIGEHDAVFAAAQLECAAGNHVRGQATNSDIVAAIARAERRQELVIRAAPGMARGLLGYTTREAIATEQRMFALEAASRTMFAPLQSDDEARSIVAKAEVAASRRGHRWNDGQRAATKGLLQSGAGVTGIQGSAGTAKTTTVLSIYADAARAKGLTVRALAPTAKAADELARAIRATPTTVARLLIDDGDAIAQSQEVWIVDEASMLSARDAEQVLVRARNAEARLVLVGDVRQLGSIAAGRAFGQLQDNGMPTFKLAEIVRQTNPRTRRAVEALLVGDVESALTELDEGGGEVVEHAEEDVRHARIARDFARLSSINRAKTLVLDPTRAGRQKLTDAIRAELLRDGTLGDQAIVANVLEPCSMTQAARSRAASYGTGTIVLFRKDDDNTGLKRNTAYRVDAIDPCTNMLRLLDPANREIPWNPAYGGADEAETYTEVEQEFRTGDRIQFTRNNHTAKRVNGRTATVVAIDPDAKVIVVATKSGKRQNLDMDRVADRHIRPGWVQTIHAAQGSTSDRVMAHLESFRSNVDARMAYVAISRAKTHAAIYTDDRLRLEDAIEGRDGAKVGAMDEVSIINRTRQPGGGEFEL